MSDKATPLLETLERILKETKTLPNLIESIYNDRKNGIPLNEIGNIETFEKIETTWEEMHEYINELTSETTAAFAAILKNK